MSDLKALSNADLLAGIVAQARKDALQEAVNALTYLEPADVYGQGGDLVYVDNAHDAITALMEADT